MAESYMGIPLRSAIIVRHTPNDHRADSYTKNKGAVPVSMASTATDYIGRYGKYAEKGDIERDPTTADGRLSDDYRGRWADGHSLEYIARLGGYADKGAERQVDASLWNQYGPVDAAEAARQMTRAGGAFVDSIVTVKREYAEALGLSSKEDMQRLIRSTWTDSVREWGLVAEPSDIRWVAAYHTDADRSLHVHIHTWSARGEIAPGATVSPDATRRAKDVVYRVGYSEIRAERDRRATFIRDLSVLEARRQLGLEVTREQERRIADRAEHGGWPERLSERSDMDAADAAKAGALCEKLKAQLETGRGRLADNYAAQATARDILRTLEKGSPAFARLTAAHADNADAKAAMRGYGTAEKSREAREFVKAEMQDRVRRMANSIVRAHVQGDGARQRPMREDLSRLDARSREGWSNVSFSSKLGGRHRDGFVEVRIPGTRDYARIPESDAAQINRGRGHLAAVEDSREYRVRSEATGSERAMTGAELAKALGKADMDRIAALNPRAEDTFAERQREAESRARRAAAERREREQQRDREAASGSAAELRARSDYAVRHGLTLSEAGRMGSEAERIARSLAGSGVRSYEELSPRDKASVDRLAETLVGGSSRMREVFERTAESMSARTGAPRDACYESLRAEAVRQTREAVVHRAASGTLAAAPREQPAQSPPMGFANAIASLAESMVRAVGQSQAGGNRPKSHARHVERSLDRELERERD